MRIMTLALLVAGALMTVNDAHAQARQPPRQWKDPSGPPVGMDVWLRRLVGRFRFEGMVHVPSKGDCGEPRGPAGVAVRTCKGRGGMRQRRHGARCAVRF